MAGEEPTGDHRPDADACAAEPIRTPGSIQPHGMLLVADPARDLAVIAGSENLVALPGAGGDPLSRTVADLLGPDFAATLRRRAQAESIGPSTPWETTLDLPGGAQAFEVACHAHAGNVLIEIEPTHPSDAESALVATRRLARAIAQLREHEGALEDLAATAVRSVRALTGYERVLVYRFDTDWHGETIAEDLAADWPHSLLGLHFPASDIPSQARALYTQSLLRWVPSRDARAVPLRRAPGWDGPAIDLSHAKLRSLSPTHMAYHRNLGVDGSMSISIMERQHLWGLMVCHHRASHRTSAGQRAAAAALTDAFALRIGPAEQAGQERARTAGQRRFATLIAHLAQVDDLQLALTTGPVDMRDLLKASGAAVVQGPALTLLGATPPRAAVEHLTAWLRAEAPPGEVFATETMSTLLPGWTPHAATASGVLAVFLTADRADMLLWFRPEEPTDVSWGGNPNKPAADTAPRKSFDRWVEQRRGAARPWAAHQLDAAAMLRHAITEVIVRNLRRIASLNEQLRHSQKMEAVGQLTGGLAHDFNNILGGITGSLELAQTRLAQGRTDEIGRYLTAALGATHRAASLTHRLLAFSRRQTLDPKPTDVNRLIASMEELIRRTVNPAIDVECITSAGLWTILCDANQLENALLNLALNARDAMAGSGRLTIEATNTRLDDASAARFDIPPGHYVAIAVSDTGPGMAPDIVSRAFEPFFTTKPLGQGTGLGLSMVYGFARQSGGQAQIYSEVGHGTTVRLYLPRHLGPAEAEEAPAPPGAAAPRPGAVTVLVVDDEPVLRMLVCEVLAEEGYTVLEAADGIQALGVLESDVVIHLLLTDVGLPGGLNGRQVVEAARTRRPGLRVLFMTGYAENAALSGGLLDPVTQVLTKPFGMTTLTDKLRAMLPAS